MKPGSSQQGLAERVTLGVLALVLALAGGACGSDRGRSGSESELVSWLEGVLEVSVEESEVETFLTLSPLGPPPPSPSNRVADDPCAAAFGQVLFFDTRLSGNGEVACATCHIPGRGFSNGERFGEGIGLTGRNVPTIWNVAYNRWFFWDGRKDSLWSQALGPLEAPPEHGGTRVLYVRALVENPDLREGYESVFDSLPDFSDKARFPDKARPEPLRPWLPHQTAWAAMSPEDRLAVNTVFANMGKALAAYQRRIISRGAPFDTFVEGIRERDAAKLEALSASALRGLRLFAGEGACLSCHHGPSFSDLEFHDTRVPRLGNKVDHGRLHGLRQLKADRFNLLGALSDDETGSLRWKVELLADTPDKDEQFKTPSLRNVALTGPYFHHGSHATLSEVVEFYSTFEGARDLNPHGEQLLQELYLDDQEVADLVAFLESLTSEDIAPELLGKFDGPVAEACP